MQPAHKLSSPLPLSAALNCCPQLLPSTATLCPPRALKAKVLLCLRAGQIYGLEDEVFQLSFMCPRLAGRPALEVALLAARYKQLSGQVREAVDVLQRALVAAGAFRVGCGCLRACQSWGNVVTLLIHGGCAVPVVCNRLCFFFSTMRAPG